MRRKKLSDQEGHRPFKKRKKAYFNRKINKSKGLNSRKHLAKTMMTMMKMIMMKIQWIMMMKKIFFALRSLRIK